MGYDSKGILVFNLKYEHAISFINLVKFINYYQMPRSISSKLFVIASGGGEANVYGSSYYWNFRTSSFKQVACLILQNNMCFIKKTCVYTRSINRTLKIPEYVMILVTSLWIQPKCDTIHLTEKNSIVCLITENDSLKYQYRNLWNYIYDFSSPFRQIF